MWYRASWEHTVAVWVSFGAPRGSGATALGESALYPGEVGDALCETTLVLLLALPASAGIAPAGGT